MSISRLFEIIHILLYKKSVTAAELAEYFEVSTRTIYRDIEKLNLASIPIYTDKGRGGGVRLLDNFLLNKTMLSSDEQSQILTALRSVDLSDERTRNSLSSKLSHFFQKTYIDWIYFDFSGYSNLDKEKFEMIKLAILNCNIIIFEYFNSRMEKSYRKVQPIKIIFKHKNWYLKAYCLEKEKWRYFKLSRMKFLQKTEEYFDRKEENIDVDIFSSKTVENVHLCLKIDKSQSYRVMDEFTEDEVSLCKDGHYRIDLEYPENEWLYGYILSFMPYIEVIKPLHIRQIIHDRLQRALENF